MTLDFYFHSSSIYKSQEQYEIYRNIFSYWFFNNSYLITWIINSSGLSSMGFTISGFPIF